ncbi:hypothetical protein [Amphritea sp. HPY]|uniref:hypothetical protein n=1 Tax=Amphritea sp. HPY TaxID=3421652 RepID=UPI003D7C5E9D
MSNEVEAAAGLAKAAPPLAVTGMTIYGIELSDIVLIVTLVYTVLQVILLIPRYWQLIKNLFKEIPDVSIGDT